jgi:hypothetical protein
MKVRPGLTKADPTNTAEILRQPIFRNPLILNECGISLGMGGLSEGSAFAKAGCTRTKNFWNPGEQEWKSLAELGMSYHTSNKKCKDSIIVSIPWLLTKSTSPLRNRDWISDPAPLDGAPLEWIYFILDVTSGQARAIEFKRMASNGRI